MFVVQASHMLLAFILLIFVSKPFTKLACVVMRGFPSAVAAWSDAGPAVDTAAEAIRGAGQRLTGVGTDGESETSQPRQRCDDTPPGVLQPARAGRGSGSRREAGTRRGSIANGCEATTPAYT